MKSYIQTALNVYIDDNQTSEAKQVAYEALKNAGLTEADLKTAQAKKDSLTVFVFYA